jgi:hypothetical protein
MSFDQLMEHASDIQFQATKHALDNHETDPEYAPHGVDGYYANVPDLFKPFSQMPDPAKYQPLINDLKSVLQGLSNGDDNGDPIDTKDTYFANPTLTKMTTAGDYLDDWTGRAALAFKQKFIDPFPALSRNQFILVAVLKSALEAHQEMWANARKDIDNLAHDTGDALDNNNGGWCDANSWNVTFTVLSSVAAVGSVALDVGTFGAATPLTLTAVGAAAQVAAVTPPGPVQEKKSGHTAIQITNAMKSGMHTIVDQIHSVEAKISSALKTTNAVVTDHGSYFVAARPALADTHGAAETGSTGLGDHE